MPGRFIRASWWTRTAVLTAAYLLAIWVGLALLVQPERLATLWPATGVALVALLARPIRSWPIPLASLGAVHVVAERFAGFGWGPSIGLPVVALTEVAAAAAVIQHLAYRDREFTRWTMLVLVLVMPLASAVSGSAPRR